MCLAERVWTSMPRCGLLVTSLVAVITWCLNLLPLPSSGHHQCNRTFRRWGEVICSVTSWERCPHLHSVVHSGATAIPSLSCDDRNRQQRDARHTSQLLWFRSCRHDYPQNEGWEGAFHASLAGGTFHCSVWVKITLACVIIPSIIRACVFINMINS